MSGTPNDKPIVIIGGGIIGLSIGWVLARTGTDVTIIDRGPSGKEASWVAGGLLAPHAEVGFEDEDFLRVGVESLKLYPGFLDELAEDSGERIELDRRGTLIVALDRDDTERIRRLYDFRLHLGLPVEWLLGSEAREREPLLSPKVAAAILLPDDTQVNSRRLVGMLRSAFLARGGRLEENNPVEGVEINGSKIAALASSRGKRPCSRVVLCAGSWSAQIKGIPDTLRPPVRPVKGQVLSLLQNNDTTLRYVVRSPDIYLVPKDDGRLIVGASQEEMGFDKTPTAGEVMRMLERGWEAVPAIYDLPIESIDVGLRPGTRDHLPIMGETGIDGLYYATGHFRHGILLAPLTAYTMAKLITEGRKDEWMAAFDPLRFTPAGQK